jgi:hypothetical protein
MALPNNPLANLFQQMSERKEETTETPERIKEAVFSSVNAASIVGDIVDLFTVKFFQSHAEIVNAAPQSEFGNEKEKLFNYLQQKFADRNVEENKK